VISVNVTATNGLPAVVVKVDGILRNPRGLNRVLAERWLDLMKGHFRDKNATPNALGGPRTNFWNGVASDTGVTDVTETGATITVANQPFRLHLYGGTVVPKKAKALTIPLVPEAHGLMARTYQQKFGRKLFTIGGPGKVPFLFERTDGGVPGTKGASRNSIRPVYRLAKRAMIKRDPKALPDVDVVRAALTEEAVDFVERQNRRGGLQA
jgi:hypothetical protein